MRKNKVIINFTIIVLWALLFILIRTNFKITNLNDLISFIKYHQNASAIIFLILSITRIFAFLPGMIFMIIGGIMFNPIKAFTLTLISIYISETIIFVIAKNSFSGKFAKKINKKYPKLVDISKEYNYKFLALGILCPAAPTDLACFISSYIGSKYKSFILTVILSNVPLIIVYSVLGQSFLYSTYYFLFITVIFLIISIYLMKIWNEILGE